MEDKSSKEVHNSNNVIFKNINIVKKCSENVTVLSLCCENITNFEVKLPPNLTVLDLSQNKLQAVPECVLNHDTLKALNLSNNVIEYFDDTPKFLHSIERLEISDNNLQGPPYWIWAESPDNLTYLDISNNIYITRALKESDYYDELLQYTTKLTHIKIFHCKIGLHNKLLSTFPAAQELEIGTKECSYFKANFVENIPGVLEECRQLETLNLCNTKVFSIKNSIQLLINLREIDISHNSISSVPEDFCCLTNLEICNLSNNSIIYLPSSIEKMRKLVHLRLDNNRLCMLPEGVTELHNLVMLDVYSNCIYEIPEKLLHEVPEIDIAQNYLEEPENEEYAQKKERLRLSIAETSRLNGRQYEPDPPSDQSSDRSDEDCGSYNTDTHTVPDCASAASSDSDWDSDEYWVPRGSERRPPPSESPWMFFIKAKMAAGNFCPMDIHTVSITERVKYEKLCNPTEVYESDGQFDDFSDDNS